MVHDGESEVGGGGDSGGDGRVRRSGHGRGHDEGRSWQDRAGDHWRAAGYAGDPRAKRKRREDGDRARDGKVSRPKRERE